MSTRLYIICGVAIILISAVCTYAILDYKGKDKSVTEPVTLEVEEISYQASEPIAPEPTKEPTNIEKYGLMIGDNSGDIPKPEDTAEKVQVRAAYYVEQGLIPNGKDDYGAIISTYGHYYYGDTAVLYTLDGEKIGYYECRDSGLNPMVSNGMQIDIVVSSEEQGEAWNEKYGDYVLVQWIKSEG